MVLWIPSDSTDGAGAVGEQLQAVAVVAAPAAACGWLAVAAGAAVEGSAAVPLLLVPLLLVPIPLLPSRLRVAAPVSPWGVRRQDAIDEPQGELTTPCELACSDQEIWHLSALCLVHGQQVGEQLLLPPKLLLPLPLRERPPPCPLYHLEGSMQVQAGGQQVDLIASSAG